MLRLGLGGSRKAISAKGGPKQSYAQGAQDP